MGMIGNSLAQGLISGANIQDGTVDTPDIKDSAVTAAKIASAVVTPAKMDFSAGTANGVLFLNGSKVASSGSSLVFDGTNLGIGTTSPNRKLYVQSDDSSTGGNVVAVRNANTTAGAFINFLGGGSNAPSIGAKNNAIVFTADGYSGAEWARFDASGNLFVGATGSSMSGTPKFIAKGTNSTNGLVQFENSVNTSDVNHGIINLINTATGATGNDARVMFSLRNVGASSGLDPMASIGAVKEAADYAAAIQFNTRSSAGAFSEKARFDSSGNLLIKTTSTLNGSVRGLQINSDDWAAVLIATQTTTNYGLCAWMQRTSATGEFVAFRYGSGLGSGVGGISTNGSTTSYNTSSDYRLKENIQPMTGALVRVAALKPVTYQWKIDGSTGEGFIAHELQEVVPDAVFGEKDAVNEDGSIKPQGIDTSFLVATLTAAIQEQQAIIESLTERITALEAN